MTKSSLSEHRIESDSGGNKTNQEPEDALRARIVKVVDS